MSYIKRLLFSFLYLTIVFLFAILALMLFIKGAFILGFATLIVQVTLTLLMNAYMDRWD